MSQDLNLKQLVSNNQLSLNLNNTIDKLLNQIEELNVGVTGTGDLFNCAINLKDLTDLDLDLDFFKKRNTGMNYTLLYKIQQLRRYINNINNIFIEIIGNLECCNSDDKYNKIVLPIFKWLVEDENGLTGTLLKISKELYTVYIPLKRLQCLFKPIPGNPTIGFGGADFFKYAYPLVEGLEKTMNMIDNGRFLDIIIVPVKNFHDKLLACSNGENSDLYSKYENITDILSVSMYDELTISLINELKAKKQLESINNSEAPIQPVPPSYDQFYTDNPKPEIIGDTESYFKQLAIWNKKFSLYRKDIDYKYNKDYSFYLEELKKYNDEAFKKTLELNKSNFSSSNLMVDLSTDEFKKKYKPICGCLAEIFNADGYFFPKDIIVRSEEDLYNLVGKVEWKGVSSENYYFDEELGGKKRVKIISKNDIKDFYSKEVIGDTATSFSYALNLSSFKIGSAPKKPNIDSLPMDISLKLTPEITLDEYLKKINEVRTLEDVIRLDKDLKKLKYEKQKDIRYLTSYTDMVGSLFKSMVNNEINVLNRDISKIKARIALDGNNQTLKNSLIEKQKLLTDYSIFPPRKIEKDSFVLKDKFAFNVGNISYQTYLDLIENVRYKDWELTVLNQAIMRNHTVVKLVDENGLECNCNLLCMVIKYIISLIMDVIKKVITYIINYLLKATTNKELQWWLEFISDKINCILSILDLGNDIDKMREKFDREIENSSGTIKEANNSIGNCSSDTPLMEDTKLFKEKAHIDPETLKDITWEESNYPEYTNEDIDITQDTISDDKFKIDLENVSYEDTEWKNRVIPTIVADCTLNHKIKVDWVPTSTTWSTYLNLTVNIDQFNSNNPIILNGNKELSEEELLKNTYDTIIWNLINRVTKLKEFKYDIEIMGTKLQFISDNTILTDKFLNVNQTTYNIDNIDRVWFYINDTEVKVFDRLQQSELNNLFDSFKTKLEEFNGDIESRDIEFEIEPPASMKVCSASSLSINKFEPLYNDNTLVMYPGEILRNDLGEESVFTFTPKQDLVSMDYFKKVNVPFIIEFENLSGRIFKLILLIDICEPTNIIKTNYDKNRDGVFLANRYDLVEFDSIPNNISTVYTQTDLIKKLTPYLEEEGLISSFLPGLLSSMNTNDTTGDYIDNTPEEEIYDSSLDFKDIVDNTGYKNLPNGIIKNAIYQEKAKIESLNNLVDDLELYLGNLNNNFSNIINVNSDLIQDLVPEMNNKNNSKLGIPLMVLNEEENIILTIDNKKLKLININRNFGILNPDLVIDQEIDLLENESLFVGFSTTGFTHTISWMNERKVKYSASVTTTSNILLKPTYIGSVYKEESDLPIALLCGKIYDMIFTNSNRPIEDWYNNSNTYRPDGTIGYYDFSLFDGYHVYSIPEFFKITTFGELSSVKGILYESSKFTKDEIAILLQNGKINELEQTKLTIIGERPISVNGDFIWKNKLYYKNVTFGYLDNFFCRDNLKGKSFTISFWLKQKDALTNSRFDYDKKYIISDTNNGNYIWYENDLLNIQLFGQPVRSEPVRFLFKEDILSTETNFKEKWFHHVFRYDKLNSKVLYDITPIDQIRNFDEKYPIDILDPKKIIINLNNIVGRGKIMDFSLVSMLARYDMKSLNYTDQFYSEIAALAIWNDYKDDNYINKIYNYQRKIIINEMEN